MKKNKLTSILISAALVIGTMPSVFAVSHEVGHEPLTYNANSDGTHNISCSTPECDYVAQTNVSCVYDQEVVNDTYVKSVATCTQKAKYYKSCLCGSFDNTNDDESNCFESGELAEHTGGTATCIAKAVCDICHQPYGDLSSSHTEGTPATTESPAICAICSQPYGSPLTANAITAFTLNGVDIMTETVEVEYSDRLTPAITAANGADSVVYTYRDSGGNAITVTQETVLEIGTYTITADIAADGGYGSATYTGNFEVVKANVTITLPTASSITTSDLLGSSTLSRGRATKNGTEISGTFSWVDATLSLPRGNNEADVKWTPSDTTHYEEQIVKVNVKVEKRQSTTSGGAFGGAVSLPSYLVKFNSNGGSLIANQSVISGNAARMPIPSTKADHTFAGWYTDETLTTPYVFTSKVTGDMTLYAKWARNDAITLSVGDVNGYVFGKKEVNDVAPVIRNDRTMLPSRYVAEALGATVEWNPDTKSVTVTLGETVIVITIDSNVATVNGVEETLDSAAFIENDRTYTPLRFICEKLDANVEWDGDTKTVTITK